MADDIEPGTLLVVRIHYVPWSLPDIGVGEHFVFGARVVNPTAPRFNVHRTEFPTLGYVLQAILKAPLLLLVAHGKPILDELNAGAHQHSFELWTTVQEFQILGFRAKAHHVLDTGAVVPTPVEERNLAGGREVGHVALEIPLSLFALSRSRQRNYAADARIQAFCNPLDGAAFACRIATFKYRNNPQSLVADPLLEFDQLDLETAEFLLVLEIHP